MIFSLSPEQREFHPSTAQRRLDRYRALLAGIEAAEVRSIAAGASLDFDRADYALERLVKAQIEFAEAQLEATERSTVAAKVIAAVDGVTSADLSPDEARATEARSGDDPQAAPSDLDDRSVRIACLRFATEHARGDAALTVAERMARFVFDGQVG